MLRRRPFAAVSHIAYDPPSQHTILLPIQRWGLTVRTRRTASNAKPAAHRSTAAGSGVLIVMSSTLYRNVPSATEANRTLADVNSASDTRPTKYAVPVSGRIRFGVPALVAVPTGVTTSR